MVDYIWSTPGSLTTYLSTTLNSLANLTTDLGAAIDNSSDKKTHMDLELVLSSLNVSSSTNPSVKVYIIESVDGGTNYDQGDDGTASSALYPPADKLLCSFAIRLAAGAEAKYAIKTGLIIPPGHFKLLVLNSLGVAMGASGNTLKYRTYNMSS